MVSQQPKPQMTFRELTDMLIEAANVTDEFEAWLMEQVATNVALASEHHAGCEHHVAAVTLERVLTKYRNTKKG